jgi:hypothetical protein
MDCKRTAQITDDWERFGSEVDAHKIAARLSEAIRAMKESLITSEKSVNKVVAEPKRTLFGYPIVIVKDDLLLPAEPIIVAQYVDSQLITMRCETCGHTASHDSAHTSCGSKQSEYGAVMPLGCDGTIHNHTNRIAPSRRS